MVTEELTAIELVILHNRSGYSATALGAGYYADRNVGPITTPQSGQDNRGKDLAVRSLIFI
jgi:hypothetical protein